MEKNATEFIKLQNLWRFYFPKKDKLDNRLV